MKGLLVIPFLRNRFIFERVKAPKIDDRKWQRIKAIRCRLRSSICRQLSRCSNVNLFLRHGIIMTITLSTLLSAENSSAQEYTLIPDTSHLSILNPSFSARKTLKVRLNNGLEAYLVSDPKTEQSAASLSVASGSWDDPEEYPGMAHFLEHMLFLGTKAYPQENEYSEYISDNGGTLNAATYPDHTVYMFSINNEAFEGALDRFSHFFIDPLLSPSCINRELHAVDQEHAKNIENDNWRQYMVLKATGNPKHPNAGFSTGNAKTLSGIPQSALRNWYLHHYQASEMHLFAISPLPLEKMLELCVQSFSPVQNTPRETLKIEEPMLSKEQLGHMLYIEPVKDLRKLSLIWEVPKSLCGDAEKTALELIGYALSAEGSKSLITKLKKAKIAENLHVELDRYSKDQFLFIIDLALTPYGVSQIDKATELCFQAIARLKQTKIPEYLFKEMQQLALYRYQYQSRENAFHLAMKSANELLYEELATYPRKTTQPEAYNESAIDTFLAGLTPENCLFSLVANPSLSQVQATESEKWMNAQYTLNKISEKQQKEWSLAKADGTIDLPEPNPFLPENLTLLTGEETTTPTLIENDALAKIYYLKDHAYQVPESVFILNIKTPLIDGSAKSCVLTNLFLKALTEKISQQLFQADSAGIHTSFRLSRLSLDLTIQGYSDKLPLVAKEIFQNLHQVTPTQEEFELYKQAHLSRYENASKELPILQAHEIANKILTNDSPTNSEKAKALQAISFKTFTSFAKQLLESGYLEGFIFGNISAQEAARSAQELKTLLGARPYPQKEQHQRAVVQMPENAGPYLLTQPTERQGNGVLLVLSEGSFSFKNRAAQQLLGKALKAAFYDTLRTKQQTAYYITSGDKEEQRELFQFFAVQSSTHQPRDLLARFDLFLEDFIKNFPERLSEERFESLKKMLITTLQTPPENLQGMADRLFLLAFNYEGDFAWYEKRIQTLEELTYEELHELATRFLSRSNSKRLAILVEGTLTAENDFRYTPITEKRIQEICTYLTPSSS